MHAEQPRGFLVLDPGGPGERIMGVVDRFFVGRECPGIDDSRRLLLPDDLSISRNHVEVRIDAVAGSASVVDTSSNGTRVNGIRIERAVPVPIADGDRIQIGSSVIEYRVNTGGAGFAVPAEGGHRETISASSLGLMAMVVGDIINFSTVSETADHQVLSHDVDVLYGELRSLLSLHRGTLGNYVGDAFFCTWEYPADPSAATDALAFAVDAAAMVGRVAPRLTLRYADGGPLRMGWGASYGPATIRLLPGAIVTVLGDATNVAFRLSALAGRDGRPDILATDALSQETSRFRYAHTETVTVKGREAEEIIHGVFPLDAGP